MNHSEQPHPRRDQGVEYREGEGLTIHESVKTDKLERPFPAPDQEVEEGPVKEEIFYTKERVPITLSYRMFSPKLSEGEDPRSGEIIFIPGVGVGAGDLMAQRFGEDYARAAKKPVRVISTFSAACIKDSLKEESDAIIQFIKKYNIHEPMIVGNSQGGYKAMYVAAALDNQEKNGEAGTEGLVLLASPGLDEKSPKKLLKNFFMGDVLGTRNELRVRPEEKGTPAQTLKDVIAGAQDRIASESAAIPAKEARDEWAKEHLFTESAGVSVITPTKLSFHNDTFWRENAARASLSALERLKRKIKTQDENFEQESGFAD